MSPLKCPYGLGKYSPWLADEENFSLQIVLKGQNGKRKNACAAVNENRKNKKSWTFIKFL